jgi:AcrR family transcriptional regulator
MQSVTASSVRSRIRAELVEEIKASARRQLANEGAAALSLRAVARDMGMVSSAVYRYFPSRDDLLTALIIDAYNAMGERVEQAESIVRRTDYRGRWMAVCHAVRRWATENPHEYGLVFGTPVPKYAAPADTITPATRVTRVLVDIMIDAVRTAALTVETETVPKAVRVDLAPVRSFFGEGPEQLGDDLIVRGIMAWTHLYGAISFELFGHRVGSVSNHDGFFDHEMRRIAAFVGL